MKGIFDKSGGPPSQPSPSSSGPYHSKLPLFSRRPLGRLDFGLNYFFMLQVRLFFLLFKLRKVNRLIIFRLSTEVRFLWPVDLVHIKMNRF